MTDPRKNPVTEFGVRPEGESLRRILDILQILLGKVVSLAAIALLVEIAGHTVTNAATTPGTALTKSRTTVDFGDAGIDSVRILVRGENSAAGSVTVQAFNVTGSAALATATLTNAVEQTADSDWTALPVLDGDQEIEVRVVGDGAFDPILYAVHLQMRTVQART